MGTLVTIEVVSSGAESAIERAFGWFEEIERRCTRFDPESELMQLSRHAGEPVPASPIVFEALRVALQIAEETGGAFDPTVGLAMERRGHNREFRSGGTVRTPIRQEGEVSYRDVLVDQERQTVTLLRPLILDLGAIAKGLAVDAAARELAPFADFAIDAGGDLYLSGRNSHGGCWRVGIQHPRQDAQMIDFLLVSDQAVCTSGDYERPGHILEPSAGVPANRIASATVLAPSAMLADALATAVFVMGPEEGIELLERLGLEGLLITPQMERFQTGGFRHAA